MLACVPASNSIRTRARPCPMPRCGARSPPPAFAEARRASQASSPPYLYAKCSLGTGSATSEPDPVLRLQCRALFPFSELQTFTEVAQRPPWPNASHGTWLQGKPKWSADVELKREGYIFSNQSATAPGKRRLRLLCFGTDLAAATRGSFPLCSGITGCWSSTSTRRNRKRDLLSFLRQVV